jgi:hypothetical protein
MNFKRKQGFRGGVVSMNVRRSVLGGLALFCATVAVALWCVPAFATTHFFSSSFGAAGSGAGQLVLQANPYKSETPSSGLAVNDETHNVYVADTGNHRISEFEPDGTFVRAWGWGVADGIGKELQTCTLTCFAGLSGPEPGELESPVFIAVDNSSGESKGDVYVGDSGDGLVTKFTAEGKLVESWGNNGPGGSPDGQLNGSSSEHFGSLAGIAVAPSGILYVDHPVVPCCEPSHGEIFTFEQGGGFASPPFKAEYGVGPVGLAVDGADNVYAATNPESSPTESDVVQYPPSGTSTHVFSGRAHLTGFALDSVNDDVYIDNQGTSVDHWALSGLNEEKEPPPADSFGSGHIEAGAGLAVDSSDEAVYAADTTAGRIDVFALLGPIARTEAASGLTGTSVTLNGHVVPTGGGAVTGCRFEYVEAAKYAPEAPDPYGEGQTVDCSQSTPIAAAEAVSAGVGGLQFDTVYHFRISATDSKDTNFGSDLTFRTIGSEIASESVSNVASSSVTFDASIDPRGAPTSYYFQYGLSGVYEASVPVPPGLSLGSGEGVVEVSQHVQGLQAGAVYHYRVVAVSELEVTPGVVKAEVFDGPDQTFTTQTSGSVFALPDGRQWEMVTPPQKNGASFLALGSALFEALTVQASGAGNAIVDLATQPVENGAMGYSNFAMVLSTRGGAGWSSQTIAPPRSEAPGPSIGNGGEYRFFSEDLSLGAVQPFGNFNALSPEASESTAYLHTDYLNGEVSAHCHSSCFTPLVTAANTLPGTVFGEETNGVCGHFDCGPRFVGGTPDLAHVVLQFGEHSLYEWSAGKPASEQLQPLYLLPKSEGGGGAAGGPPSPTSLNHQLSDDGSVFFDSGGHLYLQDVARRESVRLDPTGTGASFLYASSDGSRVLFSDPEQLTSAPGGGVYECRIAEGANGPACASLQLTGISAAGTLIGGSEDASYLYFLDQASNLYVDHDEGSGWKQTPITTISGADIPNLDGGLQERTSRVSPNGEWFEFMSQRPLTGYDNRDAVSGRPDEEVYLYDASDNKLVCASCNPTGARPAGVPYNGNSMLVGAQTVWAEGTGIAANVPPWTRYALGSNYVLYQSRYLSDSGRLFFDSNDALVPEDVNGTEDVYEYEPVGAPAGSAHGCTTGSVTFSPRSGGCVGLISSGTSPEESAFLDASVTGGDVFFLTLAKLAPQDFDTAIDVYDAHECTVQEPCFPVAPVAPPPCSTGDSCKAAPSPQPAAFGDPSSATFSGAGNVTPSASGQTASKAKPLTRGQKLARALKDCAKKRSRARRSVCERGARKQYARKSDRASAKRKGKG